MKTAVCPIMTTCLCTCAYPVLVTQPAEPPHIGARSLAPGSNYARQTLGENLPLALLISAAEAAQISHIPPTVSIQLITVRPRFQCNKSMVNSKIYVSSTARHKAKKRCCAAAGRRVRKNRTLAVEPYRTAENCYSISQRTWALNALSPVYDLSYKILFIYEYVTIKFLDNYLPKDYSRLGSPRHA
jgi:hypothetical protein